jgi:hypothetical protein
MSEKNQVRQPARDVVIVGYTGREGLDWRKLKLPKTFGKTAVIPHHTSQEPPSSPKPRG